LQISSYFSIIFCDYSHTIELDKESAEIFQTPLKKLSKQVNDLIGMFKKADYKIEDAQAPVPETKPPKAAPKKSKKKSRSKISVKSTILNIVDPENWTMC
jgi:hypothetical protein